MSRVALGLLCGAVVLVSGCAADATPATRTAVFIGDSYAAGDGATTYGWTDLVVIREGWRQRNLARGGTGYLATSDARGCGLKFCPNYGQVVPTAVEARPDVVIVSGGRNDVDQYDHAESAGRERAAIGEVFTSLRNGLPDKKIYAVSPIWDDGPTPPGIAALGRDVQAAVVSAGGTYLDVGQPLAGRRNLVSADGVHPNDQGYAAIADAVIASLKRARESTGG